MANALASLLHEQRRHKEAEALYRRALLGRQQALGAEHDDTQTTAKMLAGLLKATKRVAAARRLVKEHGLTLESVGLAPPPSGSSWFQRFR